MQNPAKVHPCPTQRHTVRCFQLAGRMQQSWTARSAVVMCSCSSVSRSKRADDMLIAVFFSAVAPRLHTAPVC